jgi:hypothetical protein
MRVTDCSPFDLPDNVNRRHRLGILCSAFTLVNGYLLKRIALSQRRLKIQTLWCERPAPSKSSVPRSVRPASSSS